MFFNLIGAECAGKDTQKELLLPLFPNVINTREPGGTPEAEIIREIILSNEYTDTLRLEKIHNLINSEIINDDTRNLLLKAEKEIINNSISGIAEMYLYTASRSESLEKVVRPALEKHHNVFGNRSVACSMAYQGFARGLGMDKVWETNEPIVKKTFPHFEIFIDIPTEVLEERLSLRSEKQDRLDNESLDFHKKVREGYLTFYDKYCPYNYHIIDGVGTIQEVHERIKKIVVNFKEKQKV